MNRKKLEDKLVKNAIKKNSGEPIDERVQAENSAAITVAFAFACVLDMVMIIYHFILRHPEKTYPYIAQLLVMAIGLGIANVGKSSSKPPKTLYGKDVSIDKGAKSFAKRALLCCAEMLIFSAIITAFEAYSDMKFSGSMIIDALISAVVLILLDIIICEHRVRRYRRYLAAIADEENNLD